MTLQQFLNSLPLPRRAEVAARCGTSFEYLRQIGYGNRPCSARIAVCLERESGGLVTRKSLFPDDWINVWPELDGVDLLPQVPVEGVPSESEKPSPE
jgi:DNA-binding transcriptional regulator YdaS (Cro superfamily)